MSTDEDPSYNNTHRALLQALLSRQAINLDAARPLLAAIQTAQTPDRPTLAADVTQQDWDNHVAAINHQISPFDLEIRHAAHQVSRDRVYALVNTTSDALTQMATLHSPDEIAFVKRVLDAMFVTHNTPRAEIMAVTSLQALKLARPSQGPDSGAAAAAAALTQTVAQQMLDSMEEEGWFERSRAGYYSLTPRALMELRGWLIETYNDEDEEEEEEDGEDDDEGASQQKIKFCPACRDIVTVGQRCPSGSCSTRIHDNCLRNLFRAQQNREECPKCNAAWVDPLPVGEAAARGGDRRRESGRASMVGRNGDDDDDDDDDD